MSAAARIVPTSIAALVAALAILLSALAFVPGTVALPQATRVIASTSALPRRTITVTVTKFVTITTRRTSTSTRTATSTRTPSVPATTTAASTTPRPSSTSSASRIVTTFVTSTLFTTATSASTRVATPTSSSTTSPMATSIPSTQGKRLIAYLTSWSQYAPRNYLPTDLPVELLTHVNYAFANIVNGKIAVGDPWGDVDRVHTIDGVSFQGNFGLLNDPRSPVRRRNPNLRTLISVGGWSWSKDFSIVARTAAARKVFVDSVVEFVRQYRFDGVDYDWEYPGAEGNPGNIIHPDDGANFSLLLAETRRALEALAAQTGRKDSYLVTIATSATESVYSKLDGPGVARACDFVNVMTYDAAGSWSPTTDFHSSIPFSLAAIEGHIRIGIPANKVALGIPFYARGFANVQLSASNPAAAGRSYSGLPAGAFEAGIFEYDKVQAALALGQYTRAVDSTAGVPVYYNTATRVWMSGEDVESAERKGRLVRDRGLAGAFWWESSMDKKAELVSALKRGMGA